VISYRVNLDSVTVGDITLYNVEGVGAGRAGEPLLGMSFLNRTEMRNDGQNLTLTKRY
jgi:aspartyl protease family protein